MVNPSQYKKPSAPPGPAFDPWLLWVALRRHWAWTVSTGLLVAVVGATVVFVTFEPEFEATHILQANRNYVLSKDLVDVSKDLAKNERMIILSHEVLSEVLADPELKSVPSLSDPETRESEIRKRVKISNGGSEDLLMIGYRDTDRKQVAKVANAIAEEYKKERRRYDELQLRNVEKSLMQPIDQARRNVEDARRVYEDLSKKVYGKSPFSNSGDSPNGESTLSQDRRTLIDLDLREGTLNSTLTSKQSELSQAAYRTFSDQEIKAYVDSNEAILKLRGKIRDNEAEIRKIEQKEQQGFFASRYRELKKDLGQWETDLERLVASTREKAEGALRESEAQKLNQAIKGIESQIAELIAKREAIGKQVEEEKARLEKSGVETADLAFASKKVDSEMLYFDKLNDRFLALRAELGRGASVSSRSMAKDPNLPLEETPIKKIVMVAGVAFLLPFLLAVLVEFHAKRITNAESIDTNQIIPILGEIARIPTSRKRSTGHRLFEESIDAMRANLLFKVDSVRTIAVTSAVSGEGKSNVTFELASSIARCSGEKVLVIDADLRNPDQHDLFGLELGPGLCKLLSGDAGLDECIQTGEYPLVHLLSAGRLDSNPHNLLTRSKFQKVLEQVTARYRYVIVDTAPVLPAAETLTITAACDATLLCAMRDVSQSEHVKRTFRRLEESDSNVIGAVFSGVPSRIYAARYGDYRYAQTT